MHLDLISLSGVSNAQIGKGPCQNFMQNLYTSVSRVTNALSNLKAAMFLYRAFLPIPENHTILNGECEYMPDILSPADTTVASGAFNRRITIQSPVDVADGEGGSTRTWSTVVSTWAHIEPWKGAEKWLVGQVYSNMWVKMLIRYRPSTNITPVMRITYGNRIYRIRAVNVPAEAQTTIELLCEELQTYGSLH